MREVTRTTVTSTGKIRVSKDGSISSGTPRGANNKKTTTHVDVTRSTERSPFINHRGNGNEQKEKPVSILRALRKAFSAATGASGAFTPRSRRDSKKNRSTDDGEITMSVIEAIEEVLDADDDDECCECPNVWTLLVIVVTAICVAAFAIETNLLTYVAPCAAIEYATEDDYTTLYDLEDSIWTAAYYGNIFGCLIAGPWADATGRKRVMMASLILVIAAGSLSALSTSYRMLWWLRFLVGCGEGGCAVAESLIAEFVPPSYRGIILNTSNVGWGTGSVFVCVAAKYIVPYYGYKAYMVVCVSPMVLAVIGLSFLVESPQWLLQNGKHDKALEALKYIAKRCGTDVPCTRLSLPDGMEPEPAVNQDPCVKFYTYTKRGLKKYRLLLSGRLWKRTLVCMFLGFWSYFAYASVVIFDDDVEAADDGTFCAFNYDEAIFFATSEIVFSSLLFPIIDKTDLGIFGGRFGCQWMMYSLATVTLVWLASATGTAKILFLGYISRGAIAAASGVTFIQVSEWFPTNRRATAICTFYMIAVIGAIYGADWAYKDYSADVLAIGISVSCLLCILPLLVLPNTAGVNLEELDQEDADLSIGCNCRRRNCCCDDGE